jgi:hypothetical protein
MPRTPRKFLFDPEEVGVYHCVNRCVRRPLEFRLQPARFDHIHKIASIERAASPSRLQLASQPAISQAKA